MSRYCDDDDYDYEPWMEGHAATLRAAAADPFGSDAGQGPDSTEEVPW